MIFNTPVITPRLTLKPESIDDFYRFFDMSKDPEVMRWIGDGSIYHWSKETALKKYQAGINNQGTTELGNLAVYAGYPGLYIGWCGVTFSKFLDHAELGYRYCRDAWGQGYATEAAAAVIAETFRKTEMDRVLAIVHPANSASIRVLEKIGFVCIGTRFSRASDTALPVYALDREGFTAAKDRRPEER